MVKNTKMSRFSRSYEVNSHVRYVCEDGYKRQAGTSNLAICQLNSTKKADWKYGNISCIRDPSIPITTPSSTESPLTTVSSSSHASTSSSTTVETFTTMSLTPTIKIHKTRHTTQGKVPQTTQISLNTPVIWLSTIDDQTAPGRTHSPGLQLFTPSVSPKETGKMTTEQHGATVTENTRYTATVTTNFRTPVPDTNSTESPLLTNKIMASATGTMVIIILLIIILAVYCQRRRSERSSRKPEDTQIYVQTITQEDNSPGSDAYPENIEEETFL
ncbi:interleukin-15 receptor subunit alpha isoform X2 [Dendropsophus ebraccatus]